MKCATLLLLLTAAAAGVDDLPRTTGYLNGYAWRRLDGSMKVGYLFGLSDGQAYFGPLACIMATSTQDGFQRCAKGTEETRKNVFGKSTLSLGELEEAVDGLYSDPANLQIPIVGALEYFQLKRDGAAPEVLERDLANRRRDSANPKYLLPYKNEK
jgi:hypothetical protein